MNSDESSINQSAFLNSFSAYSEASEIETIEIAADNKKNVNSPITESINDIMHYKLKKKVSLSCVKSVAQLLNSQRTPTVLIPDKVATLKKISSMRFDRKFVMLCCKSLCDENGMCRKCRCITKKQKSNFVVQIDIEQQIKYLVHKHIAAIIDYKNREKDGFISDVDDGLLYKRLSKENPDDILLTFTLNSDGAPVYNSNKVSMWPLQLYANFLPPNIRFKQENILIHLLYVSKEKPDLTELFYPLSKEINQLQQKKMKFCYKEKVLTCIPIILLASFDLPARAMASGLKQ